MYIHVHEAQPATFVSTHWQLAECPSVQILPPYRADLTRERGRERGGGRQGEGERGRERGGGREGEGERGREIGGREKALGGS